ncbi:uncharacterized protein K444DRAFT_631838 [Hyaloscypha bicolor E]|uniref:NAD(P)-binding protein n=1 Tax=Hyaloscypha bicolor E TaxID=1095630 RepID=A0A2J6T3T9_9HELO|nr:uncharacterized protein K444DRAFT_631838 [Hyaloscypha bicolor E]PMD57669.1 hypothetical protein K444DRAFT_631838 [Hyaloscypha bicolor E]
MASSNNSTSDSKNHRANFSRVPKIDIPKIIALTKTKLHRVGIREHCRKLKEAQFREHVNQWWKNSLFGGPKDPKGKKKDFTGKTVVMIGATSDICAEAAIKIARLNAAKLIIGARNIRKAHENFVNYVQEYRETLGIHAVVLNINHHTEDLADDHGQVFRSRHGTELHLQINVISTAYLAIFLLALLLETSLKEDSTTHLEFVGCERYIVHQRFEFLLNGPEHSILQYLNKDPDEAIQYPATKILQMGIMFQLAKRVNPANVIIFSAEPGPCEKPPWKDPDSDHSGVDKFCKRAFARTAEQGSRIIVSGLLQEPKANSLFRAPLHGRVYKDDDAMTWGPILSDNVFLELIARFRKMKNWQAIKCIVPAGQSRITADRIQMLRWGDTLRGTLPEGDGKYDNFSWEDKPHPQPRPVSLARLRRDREEVKEVVDVRVGTWLDGVPVPEEIREETVEAPADDNADEETASETRRRLKGKQKMHSIIDPP